MKTEFKKFSVSNGINIWVVGTCAVPSHQEWRAFVQIVNHRRVPLMKHTVHSFGGLVRLLMRVTIDVDKGVF